MEPKYISEKFKHIVFGGDYNPEQWLDTPEILDEDVRLFKLANCNEMTVGIFSWSALEPEEGKFNFEWLDKVIDDIYNAGGRIILATPSGARPQWLAKKYPEVLRVSNNGVRIHFSDRHNHCYTSPAYREKVSIIDKKLAERYGKHPAVIAWHISNEFGGECFCPLCQAEFRKWLKRKYGTLENLNKQWWTAFWSHTYTDWEQIEPPLSNGERGIHGLTLDWQRFVTDRTADFIRCECEAIKSAAPQIPVTTNLMGFYKFLDYRVIANEVDFISWDNYPNWTGDPSDINIAVETAMTHDVMRCLKKNKPFYLMESTPSHVNWRPVNKLMKPGVNTLSSLQAVAHGSDSVQYFQWRKSRGSFEKFHGAVVDHVGNENTRVFREVSALGSRLKKLDNIVGSIFNSDVALLSDWPNRWAIDSAAGFQSGNKKYLETLQSYYLPFWKRGINTDIIGEKDTFDGYKILIAPMLYMVSEELGKKLEAFVKGGGILVCTYMTGMTNENDLVHLGGFPGAGLRKVFGIWNEEIDTLYPQQSNTVEFKDGSKLTAHDYCELLHTEGAEALAAYSSDFYAGMPAVTVNRYGNGAAYYIAFRDGGAAIENLADELLRRAEIEKVFDGNLPYGVTVHTRQKYDEAIVFLQNFNSSEVTVKTEKEWKNVENGEALTGEIRLSGFETLILNIKSNSCN